MAFRHRAAVLIAFLAAGLCRAEIVVRIEIPDETKGKEKHSRIASSRDATAERLQGLSESLNGAILTYQAAAWKKDVTPQDKKAMMDRLISTWGKGNVRLEEPRPAAKAGMASRAAPASMKRLEKRVDAKLEFAAISAPDLFYDGGLAKKDATFVSTAGGGRLKLTAAAPGSGFVTKKVPPPKRKTAIPELKMAGIVYNETAELRPQLKDPSGPRMPSNYDAASMGRLQEGRKFIAFIAEQRKGRGVAPSVYPKKKELRSETVAMCWRDAKSAAEMAVYDAKGAKECREKDCEHFVIWPSDDKKKPTEKPRIASDWPYTEAGKIKRVFGPFRNPTGAGDVPVGTNIYIFIYCGVR